MSSTAILILAAGESRRMGQAKQLLPLGDTTMLGHSLRICQASKIGSVWIVLGARAEKIQKSLPEGDYRIVMNDDWQEGMGSSIAVGVKEIQQDPQILEVMIVLADQVKLTARSLRGFHTLYKESEKSIAISTIKKNVGPPGIFDRKWFNALSKLRGDKGAKSVVKASGEEYFLVTYDGAEYDIDTPEEYDQLTNGQSDG